MGILNVTPDSFYDGGRYFDPEKAVERALEIEAEGADIIDVGGESTRPGADPVSTEEELRRTIPIIKNLRGRISIPISIDTRKAEVAEKAIREGAQIVNDISGLRYDPRMAVLVAEMSIPIVIMHMKGSPKEMQRNPVYSDLIGEIYHMLEQSIHIGMEAGIPRAHFVVDPGIGFGKTWADNFIILRRLSEFYDLGCPLLIGVSRKSFIGKALGIKEEERLFGTAAAVAASVLHGAHIVRVHDVKEMVQVVHISDRIKGLTE
jgi:dihydropteroate synthase